MDLTLREAAVRLGCRTRTLRDRIRRGQQPAYKRGRQWMVRPADLPLTDAQRQATHDKVAALHPAVDAAIPEHLKSKLGATALDRLDVFAAGRAILREMSTARPDCPATAALRGALLDVAVGHHRFEPPGKVEAFERARGGLSRAVATLWLVEGDDDAPRWAAALEGRVIPRLGGLIRWAERLPGATR